MHGKKKNLATEPKTMSRRKFVIGSALALAGGILGLGLWYSESSKTSAPNPETRERKTTLEYRLSDARAKKLTPQKYLQMICQTVPEYVSAQKSGVSRGMLYNPSEKEITDILNETFQERVKNKQDFDEVMASSIENLKKELKEGFATIMPTAMIFFGKGVPMYMVFTEQMTQNPELNDSDIKSVIIHELKHMTDWFYGITLNGIHINYNTISPNTLRLDFLTSLLELRATYEELENLFRQNVEHSKNLVSPSGFGRIGASYSANWNFLNKYPATELESKARTFQLQQFAGIIPREDPEQIYLDFNLFGYKSTANLSKGKK